MKKLVISILVIAAFVVAPVSVFAQNTVLQQSKDVTGHVRIINPITLSSNQGLEFGNIASNGTDAFTATVDHTTATTLKSSTGGALLLGSCHAADFTVNGESGFNYLINRPTSLDLTAATGATGTVSITSFSCSKKSNGEGAETISESGSDVFYLGGTLEASAKAHGTFNGTISVTVQYQ